MGKRTKVRNANAGQWSTAGSEERQKERQGNTHGATNFPSPHP